ncbi:NUDIX hydrolase [Haladaptatus sp. NG-SE-30]
MTLDDLWFLATQAEQHAEQAYHRLTDAYSQFLEFTRTYEVSRYRFRTLAERVSETGAPYGAHTLVYRPSGEILLVWHDGVDMWVLPGGGIHGGETFREAAERELREEAGIEAEYDGLAIATRTSIKSGNYSTWGVLPVFEARAETTTPTVDDPDGEITDAKWVTELPDNTRDREQLLAWQDDRFSSRT